MQKINVRHVYPTFENIQKKYDKNMYLTAEEELLHYVSTGQYDKLAAQKMLQEWFPAENFPPIL